jgi:hypothetical protein
MHVNGFMSLFTSMIMLLLTTIIIPFQSMVVDPPEVLINEMPIPQQESEVNEVFVSEDSPKKTNTSIQSPPSTQAKPNTSYLRDTIQDRNHKTTDTQNQENIKNSSMEKTLGFTESSNSSSNVSNSPKSSQSSQSSQSSNSSNSSNSTTVSTPLHSSIQKSSSSSTNPSSNNSSQSPSSTSNQNLTSNSNLGLNNLKSSLTGLLNEFLSNEMLTNSLRTEIADAFASGDGLSPSTSSSTKTSNGSFKQGTYPTTSGQYTSSGYLNYGGRYYYYYGGSQAEKDFYKNQLGGRWGLSSDGVTLYYNNVLYKLAP